MTVLEDEEECASCHSKRSKAVPLQNYPAFRATQEPRMLCWLCACTPAGNAQQYPNQFQGQTAILETICFVGNEILKAINDKPEGWYCGCGWPNGIGLSVCAQCGRTPLDGQGVPF